MSTSSTHLLDLERINRMARQLLDMPIALISLADNDRQRLVCSDGQALSGIAEDDRILEHLLGTSDPLVVEDASVDPRFKNSLWVSGEPFVRFVAGAALRDSDDHPIGTLCLLDTRPRSIDANQYNQLKDLVSLSENLMRSEAPISASRLELESALVDSERQARLVIEGTDVGTWEWNVQTGETVFNERWAEIVGYTLAELAPISIDTWMSLAHPDDLAQSEALLNAHFRGETRQYDCKARMRHKQGHWVWVHDRGQVFEWTAEGEPLLMYGTHADISRDIKAQQTIEESLEEFSSLIANMPGVTYRCRHDTPSTVLYVNDQVQTLSGYKAEELINNTEINLATLIHPDDVERVAQTIQSAVDNDEDWHLEYRIRHRTGGIHHVEERGRAVAGSRSENRVLEGLIVDISREKESLAQLNKHHEVLVLLNDIAFNTRETVNDKLCYALARARQFLGMELAIISQIESDVYTARWVDAEPNAGIRPGQTFSLGATWCQLLFSGGETELFLSDAPNSPYAEHPCYQSLPLGSYIGVTLTIEGEPFGTLNFSSSIRRGEGFDETDRLFIRLLTRWVSDLLESDTGNERLNKLLAQLPGMVYQYRLFPDGRSTFPFSSHQIESLYGIRPDQAARDASRVFDAIHPDDLEAISRSIEDSNRSLKTWQGTYRVKTRDNSYRWIAGQARPERLSDGSTLWHGYLHDIHDQELARQALERNETRFRSLFEFAPIGMALNDYKTGLFIDLNDALIKPTGYTREEFIQLSYWQITPEEYAEEEQRALSDLKTLGRYGPLEKEYIRKDGSRYPVKLQGMLSQDPDGRPVIWSLIEDISERRRLERMKDQFIATVSHELRTPLTSIKGSLGLLAGGALGSMSDRAAKMLHTAQRNADRLSSLINDLLDMEKLVAGKMPMNFEQQTVGPLLDEAIDSMTSYGAQHDVQLVAPDSWPEVQVNVDGTRLMQALNNLISNAIKFSPEGGAVEISVAPQADAVEIRVRDSGPGIAPDFRSELFKRFSQADGSDRRKLPGTGLGLAITREISRQLGGEVGYRDGPQRGSEFFITLPRLND
ncbi:PAS domain S-box-containing protein [Marinimicrobium koreense]|uniref:histidine kinase n=1 Tax=Marinimicrobium koreense TaxID=306545 RepID=A0A3N1P0C5_9GAMM|nr:PAS domain-containing protein [Marinimicrobium koreense]ROQ20697.1 PAS domain S-box-containing protein [Marinimicrobium koreense]